MHVCRPSPPAESLVHSTLAVPHPHQVMHHHRGVGPAISSSTAAAPALANSPASAGSAACAPPRRVKDRNAGSASVAGGRAVATPRLRACSAGFLWLAAKPQCNRHDQPGRVLHLPPPEAQLTLPDCKSAVAPATCSNILSTNAASRAGSSSPASLPASALLLPPLPRPALEPACGPLPSPMLRLLRPLLRPPPLPLPAGGAPLPARAAMRPASVASSTTLPLLASHTAQGPVPVPQAGSAAASSWKANRRRPRAASAAPAATLSAAAAGPKAAVRLAAAGWMDRKGTWPSRLRHRWHREGIGHSVGEGRGAGTRGQAQLQQGVQAQGANRLC